MWPGARPASLVEDADASADRSRCCGGEEDDRIEVTLHGDPRPEPVPGRAELDPPVQPDHVAPGVALEFEERAGVGAEMDDGDAGRDRGEEPGRM